MSPDARSDAFVYRERLSPSLRVLVASALCAPMVALVLTPVDTTVALAAGAVAAVLIIAGLVAASPRIRVEDGVLYAGRAHIDVGLLGDPVALVSEDARNARGRDLDPRSWTVVRGGIDGVLVVPIADAEDPAPNWIISSRTPDRLAAALRRARARPSTPRR